MKAGKTIVPAASSIQYVSSVVAKSFATKFIASVLVVQVLYSTKSVKDNDVVTVQADASSVTMYVPTSN